VSTRSESGAGGWLSGVLVAILVAGASASCASEPVPDLDPERDSEASTAIDSGPDPAAAEETEVRPFRNFSLPPDGTSGGAIERHPVRILNLASAPFVVRASAGAAPVVLDTLEPGEAYRVDLDAPAGLLRIEWRSLDGRFHGNEPVAPGSKSLADSVSIVRIEAETRSE
jgi:hypothetical protein